MYSHLYCIFNIYKRNKDVRNERFERKSWWVQVSANRVTRFLFIYEKCSTQEEEYLWYILF